MDTDKTKYRKLCSSDEMDIVKTFECGQCFRWNKDVDGVYHGIAMGFPALVRTECDDVLISSDGSDELWRDYFDLERDYAAISAGFRAGEYLEECLEYGPGIRILSLHDPAGD